MAEEITGSVAKWIGSLLLQETIALFEVVDKVESLKEELEVTQGYLRDADAKQHMQEVRTLTEHIRKLAYHMEDVIDTYISKVEANIEGQVYRNWLMKFACFVRSAPHAYKVGKEIKNIQEKLEQKRKLLVNKGIIVFQSRERLGSSSNNEIQYRRKAQSYPYEHSEDSVVGLDKDMSKLVEILMGEGNHQVNIVSIEGMGGSGKTTLARKLYNHPYVKECFDCSAWVFISQTWSTEHVLSEILRQASGTNVTTEPNSRLSEEGLRDKLREILENKSSLVVLDDVWSKKVLDNILPALLQTSNKKGSKIIVTTRTPGEVFQFESKSKHLYRHKAEPLDEADEWKLFSKIAFNQCTDDNIQSFEKLGKEMLSKCGGLPLAIVSLAGILSEKESINQWQKVSEAVHSKVMGSTGSDGKVRDLLALSYDDLPYELKLCFLYLGVFPEDFQIATGMLIRMWIAEGLITARQEMSLEDVAMEHLEKLSHRFMIQVARTNFKGEIKAIRLHDLLRELCVEKAKKQSFLEIYAPMRDQIVTNVQASAIQPSPRRVALHSCTSFPTQNSHLRSLVLLEGSSFGLSASISKDMLDLCTVHDNFKLLRLLSLQGIKTPDGTLPSQIGSLILLRYLGLRNTNITKLPRSIGNLRYLLTLDYRNIESESGVSIEIPDVLRKLKKLRHLFLPIKHPWSVANLDLSTLGHLQTLWGLKDDGGGCWLSREFLTLSATLKKLMIVVTREKTLVDSFSSPSIISDKLHTFHCELRGGLALQHVTPLSNKQRMHKLTLIGKIQMNLSLLLPANIIILELKDSMIKDEDPMTALGVMVHLKLLRVSNVYLGTMLACEAGFFPHLVELYLHNFQKLQTWRIEKGAMLRLKKLEITGCQKLHEFPQGLALLTNLEQLEFFGMPKEFGEKAREYGWSKKKLRLPHKCEAIIEKSDSPIDTSSVRRIYEQLITGIFLNNKQQKYWVMKQDEIYHNCFMVYAEDLSLATLVDEDGLPLWNARLDDWEFKEIAERDGELIKVAKLSLPVLHVLDISGRFKVGDLSPNVMYTITYLIRFDCSELSVQTLLVLPGGRIQTHRKKLSQRPSNKWVRVSVGEFKTWANDGVAEFNLHFKWPRPSKIGFEIQGAIIEPKPLAAGYLM